jgi:hypothetical protein
MSAPRGEFSWIFFVPMFVLLALTLFFLIKNLRVMFTFTRTTGTIVRFESSSAPNRSQSLYQTIVRYKTPNGTDHEAGSLTKSSSVSSNTGDAVTVYYDPVHPERAEVHTFRDSWLHIVILGSIGFILFIVWYGILVGVSPPGVPANYTRPSDQDL